MQPRHPDTTNSRQQSPPSAASTRLPSSVKSSRGSLIQNQDKTHSPAPASRITATNTAYRLLVFLRLLTQQGTISQDALNSAFLEDPLIARSFGPETLRKYLYTLERAGFGISVTGKGDNTRYHLKTSPFAWPLSKEESHAINVIMTVLAHQPASPVFKHFIALLHAVSPYCQPNTEPLLEPPTGQNWFDAPEFKTLLNASQQAFERLNQIERYCFEGQDLVLYLEPESLDTDSAASHFIDMSPEFIRFEGLRGYLVGCHIATRRKVAVELTRIQHIKQLPRRSSVQALQQTVVFRLTGRVASNYLAHPGETLIHDGKDLLVKLKTDEVDQLLRRLLKYGPACEIISPEHCRNELRNRIGQLYEVMCQPDSAKHDDWVQAFLAQHTHTR